MQITLKKTKDDGLHKLVEGTISKLSIAEGSLYIFLKKKKTTGDRIKQSAELTLLLPPSLSLSLRSSNTTNLQCSQTLLSMAELHRLPPLFSILSNLTTPPSPSPQASSPLALRGLRPAPSSRSGHYGSRGGLGLGLRRIQSRWRVWRMMGLAPVHRNTP